MSKNLIYIIVGIIIVAVLGGAGFLLIKSNSTPVTATPAPRDNTILPIGENSAVAGDLVYEDPSGFSFKYPKDVTVQDVTPDDDQFYSVLSLKNKAKALKLSVSDTKYKTVEEWFKLDANAPKEAKLTGATTLGSISAKEYEDADSIYTVSIDQSVLYVIESPKDNGGYWESTHDVVVGSFAFKGEEKKTTGGALQGDIEYEAEEVVE
jgi:hypothetical protein